jgi:tight adherence protein C
MDIGSLITTGGFLWSPLSFAVLVALACILVWLAFAPARPEKETQDRLDGYVERGETLDDLDMSRPFSSRVAVPTFRRVLRLLGRLSPQRNVDRTQELLTQAGNPGGLVPLDFFGLRVLFAALFAAGAYLAFGRTAALNQALFSTFFAGFLGFLMPWYWLRFRVRGRQKEVVRALPDALDMMTVGVEAGLAFESAMLRVGEQWDNALTRELRRAVAEMRVGTERSVALRRIVQRTGVSELGTFVAVLVQSSQLGVSISQVLHTQAAQMRVLRRQRAEELARQAGIKMIFPLTFFIFPALMVVILGPSIPSLMSLLGTLGGGGGVSFGP